MTVTWRREADDVFSALPTIAGSDEVADGGILAGVGELWGEGIRVGGGWVCRYGVIWSMAFVLGSRCTLCRVGK